MLANPATVSTSEATMNGHFLPRKSKFVFLNNSIEPCRAGAYQNWTPDFQNLFPRSPDGS